MVKRSLILLYGGCTPCRLSLCCVKTFCSKERKLSDFLLPICGVVSSAHISGNFRPNSLLGNVFSLIIEHFILDKNCAVCVLETRTSLVKNT